MVSLIVAADTNGVIGNMGSLPWNLPADLAHFKQTTMGHPIIMGRKTYESIGRPLPGRQNIIISRNSGYKAEGCIITASLKEAIDKAERSSEIFIIGGASIYDKALVITDKIYLTRVDTEAEGDKYFSFKPNGWKMVKSEKHQADNKNQYNFEFQEWVKK